MSVCREHSLLKNESVGRAGFGVKFAFKLIWWLRVPKCWGGVLFCLEVEGMELLGVWDLGYLGWTKATDLTKHGEFFSVYHGRIISLLFGHSSVFWVDFGRSLWKCLICKGVQGVLFCEPTGSPDVLCGLGAKVVLLVAKSKYCGQDRNIETFEGITKTRLIKGTEYILD